MLRQTKNGKNYRKIFSEMKLKQKTRFKGLIFALKYVIIYYGYE